MSDTTVHHVLRIPIKRVFESPSAEDGQRILVDRLWPRGVSKKSAALSAWLKAIAPSSDLRIWFGHDPKRWDEFRKRYHAELQANQPATTELLGLLDAGPATLIYAAHDPLHNHALALARYMQALASSATPGA